MVLPLPFSPAPWLSRKAGAEARSPPSISTRRESLLPEARTVRVWCWCGAHRAERTPVHCSLGFAARNGAGLMPAPAPCQHHTSTMSRVRGAPGSASRERDFPVLNPCWYHTSTAHPARPPRACRVRNAEVMGLIRAALPARAIFPGGPAKIRAVLVWYRYKSGPESDCSDGALGQRGAGACEESRARCRSK